MSALVALADGLAATGLRHAFGVPGSGPTLEIVDALEKRGVEFHTTYFEGAAALMAGTIGRQSGIPGLALAIKGPGLANMVPGLAACWFEGLPLVAGVEAHPANSDWRVRHKGMDQESLIRAVAKARLSVGANPDAGAIAGFAAAEAPGPVVVELIGGETAMPVPQFAPSEPRVADVIARAQRPVVIAGTLAIRQGWGPYLAALQVPVFTTASAKGVLDETLPQAAGVYTGVGLERVPETKIVAAADLVVCLGLRPSEVLATKPFKAPSVNIDTLPSSPAFGFAAATNTADAANVFAALSGKEWGLTEVQLATGTLRVAMLGGPFLPAYVYETVDRHFRGRVRAVFDTGYFCTIAEHAWRARRADWCLMSGQGRYMGTGIPMALGAALHDRDVPTVVFLGDGGIGTHVGELRLAVQKRLPLLVVLLTDGGFGSVRTKAMKDGLTQKPLLMDQPSWGDILASMKIPAMRADSARGFNDALGQWDWHAGPAYIEVPFDPMAYQDMVLGIR